MRVLISITVIFILFAVFSKTGFLQEQFTPNILQAQFAASLKDSVPGVESAMWKSHVDLWVKTPDADGNSAKAIAGDVLEKGSKDLGQMFCVHAYKGNWIELTKMCWAY